MKIPYRPNEEIDRIAEDFLMRYFPSALESSSITPTPIELIIEQQLGLEIVLFRGYRDRFGIDGSISTDLTNITVDEHIFDHVPTRLHFTLAHEVGHMMLHSEEIKELEADSTEGWRKQILEIPETQYRRMELQASQFAGSILVPLNPLRAAIDEAKSKLADGTEGLVPEELTTASLSLVAGWIAKKFDVSTRVAEIRMLRLLELTYDLIRI